MSASSGRQQACLHRLCSCCRCLDVTLLIFLGFVLVAANTFRPPAKSSTFLKILKRRPRCSFSPTRRNAPWRSNKSANPSCHESLACTSRQWLVNCLQLVSSSGVDRGFLKHLEEGLRSCQYILTRFYVTSVPRHRWVRGAKWRCITVSTGGMKELSLAIH